MHMSKTFFSRMFCEFLHRTAPISNTANPACMKNTKVPEKRIQNISIEVSISPNVLSIVS